jgi:hypothetical protein
VQNTLASTLESDLTNGVNTTPMMTSGANTINESYAGANAQIAQADAARGFGESGVVGSAEQQSALAEAGAKGSLQSNLDEYALQQDQNILGDAEIFGFASPGKTTSSTAAGSATAGGLAAGLTGLSSGQNSLLAALGSSGSGGSSS